MREAFGEWAKSVLEKLSLFKVLQLVWLVEFHLLGFAACKQMLKEQFDVVKEPPLITEYTSKMAEFMSSYHTYIALVAIAALVIGLSGVCLVQIPVFRKIKLLYMYTDFGIYAGSWLVFIWVTYRVFICFGEWFLIMPLIVLIGYSIITACLRKIGISIE